MLQQVKKDGYDAIEQNPAEYMEKHIGEMLTPPSADELANIEYVSKEYDISAKKNELYVSGLGFVGFNKPCKVRVTYIKGVDVESRNGIIGRKI